jgi:hypothetical protein
MPGCIQKCNLAWLLVIPDPAKSASFSAYSRDKKRTTIEFISNSDALPRLKIRAELDNRETVEKLESSLLRDLTKKVRQ